MIIKKAFKIEEKNVYTCKIDFDDNLMAAGCVNN